MDRDVLDRADRFDQFQKGSGGFGVLGDIDIQASGQGANLFRKPGSRRRFAQANRNQVKAAIRYIHYVTQFIYVGGSGCQHGGAG